MASIWENSVITDKGAALQAKILAGESISITSVKSGAGSVEVVNLKNQTSVSDIKQTLSVQKIRTEGSTAIVPVLLTNDDVTTQYSLRQIGFYANDPDEGEILYAIAQNTEARTIPTASDMPGYSLVWNFHFTLSNDVNMTATVDPAGYVLNSVFERELDNIVYIDYFNTELDKKANKQNTVISGYFSMNKNPSAVTGQYAHVEGYYCQATGKYAHAEGYYCEATGERAHAEGSNTKSLASNSHSEGSATEAREALSHAAGFNTIALKSQYIIGHNNDSSKCVAGDIEGTTGTAFAIGNGTSSSKSNAFRVTYDGQVIGKAAYSASGADMAELREWKDGNPNNEDRRGYFVTMDGMNIEIAKPGDYICGIISANPALIGNMDEDWMGRYIFDDFGSFIYEDKELTDPETGELYISKCYKINPEYDPSRSYEHRQDRPEWDFVGLCGVIHTRDDGTCEVNGFCKCGNGGIATKSDRGYRVLERVSDNIIKVLFYLTGEIF